MDTKLTLNTRLPKPPAVMDGDYRKYAILVVAALFSTILHAGFLIAFYLHGIHTMALVNIASIGLWGVAWYLGYYGYLTRGFLLGGSEAIGHAILAIHVVGPDYGFQLHLWPVACLLAIAPRLSILQAGLMGYSLLFVLALIPFVTAPVSEGDPVARQFYLYNSLAAGLPLILIVMSVRYLFETQAQRLTDLAIRDDLTGLYNRRFMNRYLQHYRASHLRQQTQPSYCVAILDIDHFKRINDTHGHHIGDQVLIAIATRLRARLRQSDVIGRWGGEEFVLLLTLCDKDAAFSVLDTLRQHLSQPDLINTHPALTITVSIGLAHSDDVESLEELFIVADKALYQAKHDGRNRVVEAPPPAPDA